MLPGRRFALALALGMFLCATGAAGAGAAQDPTVVTATLYPGSSGSVSTQSVSLSQLQGCPLYTGPYVMTQHGGGASSYQATQGATWAMSTVVQCALKQPLNNIERVQVLRPAGGLDTPLSNADLTDPSSQFNDPGGPDAAPIVSNAGGDSEAYFRPVRNASDSNSDDTFQGSQPVKIDVFTRGATLQVAVSAQGGDKTASGQTYSFTVTSITDSNNNAVSPSSVNYSWDFGDQTPTSSAAAPQHFFDQGNWPVTLTITDQSGGRGGVATVTVAADVSPATGPGDQSGGGQQNTNPDAPPTGPSNGDGQTPGNQSGNHQPTGSNHNGKTGNKKTGGHKDKQANHRHSKTTTTPASGNGSGTGTGTGGQSGTRGTSSLNGATTPSTGPSATQPGRSPTNPAKPLAGQSPNGPVVSGLLISDVRPLAADASPLVHTQAAAPVAAVAVRQATRVSPLPVIAGALLVALVFVLGAGRELYGRRTAPGN
jgi:hypothetical protein